MNPIANSVNDEPWLAVYLPDAVVPGTDNHSIFLHEGKEALWSDGCLVLDRSAMLPIWNEIEPSNGLNVTLDVTDRTV